MGDLRDCIEKAKRQGEVFSGAERQRVEQDRKIKELEARVAALENRLNAAGEIEPRELKKQRLPQVTAAEVAKRLLLEDSSNSQWIKWFR